MPSNNNSVGEISTWHQHILRIFVVKIELTQIKILQNSWRNAWAREILPFSFLFYLNCVFKIPVFGQEITYLHSTR